MLNTIQYDKDGIKATLQRPDRLQNMRALLYIKALRDLYPESRYMGTPYTVDGRVEFYHDPLDQEVADLINKSIEQFAFVISSVVELSGLPYGVPDIKDSDTIHKAYLHFMSDAGTTLYLEWSRMRRLLDAPLTDATQKPTVDLTESERDDPLSEKPEPSLVSS